VLIATVMKRMGIEAPLLQYEQLKTGAKPQYLPLSCAKAGHHPAQAKPHSHACEHALTCSRAMEITCIPPIGEYKKSPVYLMTSHCKCLRNGQWVVWGLICLAAALDWFTCRALAWRGSITLEAGLDIEA
jgi:hypothetical protein